MKLHRSPILALHRFGQDVNLMRICSVNHTPRLLASWSEAADVPAGSCQSRREHQDRPSSHSAKAFAAPFVNDVLSSLSRETISDVVLPELINAESTRITPLSDRPSHSAFP